MNSKGRFKVAAALLAVLILALPYLAGQVNQLWGDWFIVMTAVFPSQVACKYSGEAQIDQDGTQVTGNVVQYLSSGPPDQCPAHMHADLEGTLDGMTISGRLDGGKVFGIASFSGTVGPSSASGTFMTVGLLNGGAAQALSPAGTPGDPFPGVTGEWHARTESPIDVPALGFFGLVLLAGLFLIIGPFLLKLGR